MKNRFLLLLIFAMLVLPGCTKETLSLPLKTLPSGKELQRYLETHKEEERNLILQNVKYLLDKSSYEEICNTLENKIMEWQNAQSDYPIGQISLAFSNDSSLFMPSGNKEPEIPYNTISIQAEVSMSFRQIKETHHIINERIFDQLESCIMDTVYGQYKVHTLDVTIRDTDNPTEKIPGNHARTYYINNSIFTPESHADEDPLRIYVSQWIEKENGEIYSKTTEDVLQLERYEIDNLRNQLLIKIQAETAPSGISLSLIPDILEEKSSQLFQDIASCTEFREYLTENSVESIVIIYHTPWEYIPYDRYSFYYKFKQS